MEEEGESEDSGSEYEDDDNDCEIEDAPIVSTPTPFHSLPWMRIFISEIRGVST